MGDQQREMQELQDSNTSLQVQLDHMTSYVHNSSGSSQTLFTELASMSDMPEGHSQMHNLDRVTSLSAEMLDEDDFECDDDDYIYTDTAMTSSSFMTDESGDFPDSPGLHGDASGRSAEHQPMPDTVLDMMGEAGAEWGEGTVAEKNQKHMHDNHHDRSVGSHTDHDRKSSPGEQRRQLALTEELQMLLMEMSTDVDHGEERKDVSSSRDDDSEDESCSLDDFHPHQRMDHRVHRQFSLPTIQPDITDILQDQQKRIQELQKERDALQDKACGGLSPSEVLQQTRSERDAAFKRVNQLEHDLAQSRQDVASLGGQLMAAIQQKVSISQELDQWQVDLSEVLMAQMHSRITEQQRAEQAIGQLEKQVKAKRPSPIPSPFKLHKK
ncbi:hypothetical protein BaRGS_00036441 [Batillaria attramentaria]|uniref:Uncharacterized protein n=1 Tax=Batillaria attramentaria TaxID=370345 RepID=A0ABD0JBU8_9CAEN